MTRCGVDEAGRGPLAGPVYAGAVILPEKYDLPGLTDSKKLTEKARERLFDQIYAQAVAVGVGSASALEIDELNILEASLLAMRRAVEALSVTPGLLLVDGSIARGFSLPARAVIGGDGLIPAISAASVIAKVSRDRHMAELDGLYPSYGFAKHKGYGTAAHRAVILKLGPCPEHRPLFLRKITDNM